ncbi:MAG TPA: hypothetical protein VIK53_04910 [Verrucomicrobiae bacterium]
MSDSTRNRIILVLIFVLPFAFFFALLEFGNHPAPLADSPMPNPNGYDTFVNAGELLQGQAGLYETMSELELASLVASNSEALAIMRSAFSNECRVPVQYSVGYWQNHTKDLIALRNLAQTLAAEGRLAELENRPDDAAKSYLDAIHFGSESGRGGFVADVMIGDTIESLGTERLQNLSSELDAKSCRETAAALESFETNRPAWADVMEQEDIMRSRVNPGLKNYITYLWKHKQVAETTRKAENAFQGQEAKTRRLMIQLAARAYDLEKGHPPASISDLVPDYLKAIPRDPSTGAKMALPP